MHLVFFSLIIAFGFASVVQAEEPSMQTLAWPDGTRMSAASRTKCDKGKAPYTGKMARDLLAVSKIICAMDPA